MTLLGDSYCEYITSTTMQQASSLGDQEVQDVRQLLEMSSRNFSLNEIQGKGQIIPSNVLITSSSRDLLIC